jgi:hypothetical protein
LVGQHAHADDVAGAFWRRVCDSLLAHCAVPGTEVADQPMLRAEDSSTGEGWYSGTYFCKA